jgi:hypothetical protein
MDVLVVDPGELGELLVMLLQQHNIAAGHVRSGERALEAALADRPTVVVVEADLPDAPGIDVAELLQRELGCKIVLTHPPHVGAGAAEVARYQRCERRFVRPFRSNSLLTAVAELLGRSLAPEPKAVPARDSFLDESTMSALGDAIDLPDFLDDEPPSPAPKASPARDTGSFRLDARALEAAFVTLKSSVAPRPAVGPGASTTVPLTPTSFVETLHAFHQGQLRGELWCEGNGHKRVLVFDDGHITHARSSVADEDLLILLKRRRAIEDDDAIAVADAVRARTFRSTVESVLALDVVSELALHAVVEEQVKRVAAGAFSSKNNTLQLHVREVDETVMHEGLDAAVQVGDILVHLFILTEHEDVLLQKAPDNARFFPVADAPYGLDELKLSAHEARVVVAMDGTKTVQDLVMLFDTLPPRSVRGLVAALHVLGLVKLAGHGVHQARKLSFF